MSQIQEGQIATHKRMFLQSDQIIQDEPREFRVVPKDYFNIVNSEEINELSKIIKGNYKKQKDSFQLNLNQVGSEKQQFSVEQVTHNNKSNDLMAALDNKKKQLDNQKSKEFQENSFLYYSLEDVEYNDKETIQDAFAFLKELEKSKSNKKQNKKENVNEQGDNNQDTEMKIEEEQEEQFDPETFKPIYRQSQKRKQIADNKIKGEEEQIRHNLKNLSLQDDYQIE